jgi:hypothetical protein
VRGMVAHYELRNVAMGPRAKRELAMHRARAAAYREAARILDLAARAYGKVDAAIDSARKAEHCAWSLRDLLLLVMDPRDVPSVTTIAQWSSGVFAEVAAWAEAERLAASDNDVERLPRPSVLPVARATDADVNRATQCGRQLARVNGVRITCTQVRGHKTACRARLL